MASPLLDPTLLARVGDLEVVARTVVDGLRSGPHRSPFHGYSAEFSQYRHYRPGDDLKYVDWKLLARTDRLYTRQFRETTDLAAQMVFDASGSMAFADDRGPSKVLYASMAAAALAYLIADQGDGVGLLTWRDDKNDDRPAYIPPRAGQNHLRGVLAALANVSAGGEGRLDRSIRRATELLRRRGLLLVFSDFYDGEEAVLTEIRRAVRMGHDVSVFQVVTQAEIDFPYRDDLELRDLETGARRLAHAGDVRAAYRDAFAAFLERWRGHTRAEGVDYTLLVTQAPLDEALRGYLLRRRV